MMADMLYFIYLLSSTVQTAETDGLKYISFVVKIRSTINYMSLLCYQ